MPNENDQFTIPGLHQAAVQLLAAQLLPLAQVEGAVKSFVDSFEANGKLLNYKDKWGHVSTVPVQTAVATALSEQIQKAATKRAEELMNDPAIIEMINRVAAESVIQTMEQMPGLIGKLLARRILAQSDPYGNQQDEQFKWRMSSILGILNETRERIGLPVHQVP